MKRVVVVLAMGWCTTSVALHAQSSGTIQFRGSIVQGTCADTVAVNRSQEPGRGRNRCAPGAKGIGGTRDAPAYSEQRTTVSSHTGIDVLDYYVDIARSRSSVKVQVRRRDYD